MTNDRFGSPLACAHPETVRVWDQAWDELLHFRGDPLATLTPSIRDDEEFALGPVVAATYTALSGLATDTPAIVDMAALASSRAHRLREQAHVAALTACLHGEFSRAAQRWSALGAEGDFVALRLAHDVWLHVGNVPDAYASTSHARTRWGDTKPGWNHVLSMFAFNATEAGDHDLALRAGQRALDEDPADLWALHAPAHLHENRRDAASVISLLHGREAEWQAHDSLVLHLWWHLALGRLGSGEFDAVLEIHDRGLGDATTMFRLCDLISLLWRLELAGVNVGDRWHLLADRVAERNERHACGFLEVHAAMVWARVPDHDGSVRFSNGRAQLEHRIGNDPDRPENDATLTDICAPLVEAVGAFARGDHATAAERLASADATHRIGGSIAQRQILSLTHQAAQAALES